MQPLTTTCEPCRVFVGVEEVQRHQPRVLPDDAPPQQEPARHGVYRGAGPPRVLLDGEQDPRQDSEELGAVLGDEEVPYESRL